MGELSVRDNMVGRVPAQHVFQTAHRDDVYKRTTRRHKTGTIIELQDVCAWPTTMWLIIVLVIAGAALVIGSRLRISGGVNPARLGWMSAQWLAEYRASQRN